MKGDQKTLTNVEICSFCEQMAMILKSGVSIMEGLSIMMEDAGSGEGQAILKNVYTAFNQSGSLADALEEAGVFPAYMTGMVRLGEQAGRLDSVMDAVGTYYQREESISRGIKSAVTYPLIMIGMMLLIVIVLMVQVMPVFNQVFMQLGTELTGFSKAIYDAGQVLSRYSIAFVGILAVLILAGIWLSRSGRKNGSHLLLGKNLNEKIALARFAGGLSMTIASGLDSTQSLALVSTITEHPGLTAKIAKARALIDEGESFAPALHQAGIFSGIYGKMLSIGEKSGSLDNAMNKIALQYDDEVDAAIDRMLAILEPTLVAVLSIIVGLILLSVMFPLLSIMSSIG